MAVRSFNLEFIAFKIRVRNSATYLLPAAGDGRSGLPIKPADFERAIKALAAVGYCAALADLGFEIINDQLYRVDARRQ